MDKYTRFLALAASAMLTCSAIASDALCMTAHEGLAADAVEVKAANPAKVNPALATPKPAHFASGAAAKAMRPARIKAAVAAPSSVGFVDLGDKVTLKWNAAAGAGATEYKIWEAGVTAADATLLGTATDNTFDIVRNTDTGKSSITLFGVQAVAGGAESTIAASPVLTMGEIAPLPWTESFRNGSTDKFFWTERTSDNQWGLLTDAAGLTSMDGDNGVFGFLAINKGDYINLHTEKIALTGNPALIFTRYYMPTQNVGLTVVASFPDGTSKQVFSAVNNGTAAAYWKTEVVDLSAYKNYRYCTLSFNYVSNDNFSEGALVALDGLKVIDNKSVDVEASLEIPSRVLKGQTISGDFVIQNNSLSTTPALNVYVAVNGTPIISGTLNGTLGALGKGLLAIDIPTSSMSTAESLVVTARITAEGDSNPENDEASQVVALEQTWRNPVASLQAFRTPENGISLEWTAPADNRKAVEDGFEDYEPWATDFGEWTTVDNDLAFHGGVFLYSDYPGQLDQFAFKIMTPEEIGEENNSRTGRSYLGAPFGVLDDPDEGASFAASDAWLISPELSGEAQTASFYAASTPAYNALWEKYDQTDETFYILYSKTGTAVSDFKDFCYAGSISNKIVVDSEYYTKIEFAIPEGGRYFAIHHTTPAGDGCMLRIDDLSYIAGGTPEAYKVYADGEELAKVTSMRCLDTAPKAAEYAVTAIYRDGSESLPVTFAAAQASVAANVADAFAAPFDIYNLQGVAVRRGVISVADAGLAPGVYIVKGEKIVIK